MAIPPNVNNVREDTILQLLQLYWLWAVTPIDTITFCLSADVTGSTLERGDLLKFAIKSKTLDKLSLNFPMLNANVWGEKAMTINLMFIFEAGKILKLSKNKNTNY